MGPALATHPTAPKGTLIFQAQVSGWLFPLSASDTVQRPAPPGDQEGKETGEQFGTAHGATATTAATTATAATTTAAA